MVRWDKKALWYRLLAWFLIIGMMHYLIPAELTKAADAKDITKVTLTVRDSGKDVTATETTAEGQPLYAITDNGALVTPEIVLTDGDYVLEKNKDYLISGDTDSVKGSEESYQITILGRGDYTGQFDIFWKIKPKTVLDDDHVTVSFDCGKTEKEKDKVIAADEQAEYEYTGENIAPVLIVKYGETTLTQGEDYILSGDTERFMYHDGYTIKISGIGKYTGSIKRKWSITGISLDEGKKVLTYTGSSQNIPINTDAYADDMQIKYYLMSYQDGTTEAAETTEDVDKLADEKFSEKITVKDAGEYKYAYRIYLGKTKVSQGTIPITVKKAVLHLKPVANIKTLRQIHEEYEKDNTMTIEKYMNYEYDGDDKLLGDDEKDETLINTVKSFIQYEYSIRELGDLTDLAAGQFPYTLKLTDDANLKNYDIKLSDGESKTAYLSIFDSALSVENAEVSKCYGAAGQAGTYTLADIFGASVPDGGVFTYEITDKGNSKVLAEIKVSEDKKSLSYTYNASFEETDFSKNQPEQEVKLKITDTNEEKGYLYDEATASVIFKITDHKFGEYADDHNATLKYEGTKTAYCESCGEAKTEYSGNTLFSSAVPVLSYPLDASENASTNLYAVGSDSTAVTFTSPLTIEMLNSKLTPEDSAKISGGASAELFADAYAISDADVDSNDLAAFQKGVDEWAAAGTSMDGAAFFNLNLYKRISTEGETTIPEKVEYLNRAKTVVTPAPEEAGTADSTEASDSDSEEDGEASDGDEESGETGESGTASPDAAAEPEVQYEYTPTGTDYKVQVQVNMPRYMKTTNTNRYYEIFSVGADGQVQRHKPTVTTVNSTPVFQFETDVFGTYAIMFIDADYVGVERVEVTPAENKLTKIGDTVQLTATIYPELSTNKNIIWLSGDETIVKIDPATGLATAVAEGSATIYVVTSDGLKYAAATIAVDLSSTDDSAASKDTDDEDDDDDDDEDEEDEATSDSIVDALDVSAKTAEKIRTFANKNGVTMSTLKLTKDYITEVSANKDLNGSNYAALEAQAAQIKTSSFTLKWKKVSGATGYIIYGSRCGSDYNVTKLITSAGKTSAKISGLKKDVYNKYIVAAYKSFDGTKVTIAASSTIYVTSSAGKKGVAKSIQVTKIGSRSISSQSGLSASLKQGKTLTIKSKETPTTYVVKKKVKVNRGGKVVTKVVKKRKTASIKHYRGINYATSNKKVATVTKSGTVKGIGKGSCTIYAYAQNGVMKKITVKVS